MIEEPPRRPLCHEVAADGLYMGGREIWPHCVGDHACEVRGCFWRRFHDIAAARYRKPAPRPEV